MYRHVHARFATSLANAHVVHRENVIPGRRWTKDHAPRSQTLHVQSPTLQAGFDKLVGWVDIAKTERIGRVMGGYKEPRAFMLSRCPPSSPSCPSAESGVEEVKGTY